MQKKWPMLIILIISLILTATSVVFAWFTLVEKTQEIIIYSGSVKTEAKLYHNNKEIKEAFSFNNVVPKDEFDFVLNIKNLGTLDVYVDVSFVFETNNTNLNNFFKISYLDTTKQFSSTPLNVRVGSLNGMEVNDIDETDFKFKVSIDQSLSLNDINKNDEVKIKSITITLTQKDGDFNE